MNFDLVRETQRYFAALPWQRHGIKPEHLRYAVNTNLSVATEESFRFLVDNDVVTHISLDGPKEQNDKHRVTAGGKGTYETVYGNLQKLRHFSEEFFRKRVIVLSTACPDHDHEECQAFVNTLGTAHASTDVQIPGRIIPDPEAYVCTLENELQQNLMVLRDLASDTLPMKTPLDAARRASLKMAFAALQKTFAHLRTSIPAEGRAQLELGMRTCPMGFDALLIGVDGSYHMCHKTDGSLPIGHCKTGYDIDAITTAYKAFHRVLNDDRCRSCWAIRFCSLCSAPLLRSGDFVRPRMEECACIRRSAEVEFLYLQVTSEFPNTFAAAELRGISDDLHDGVIDITTFLDCSSNKVVVKK